MRKQAEYHKLVPKDPIENVKFRIKVLEKCAVDPEFRVGIREMCARDIVFWIDVFCWQHNPTKDEEHRVGPFICWDYQEEAFLDRPETTGRPGILWCFESRKTCVVEKSRDMGVSWMFLFFEEWLCEFQHNAQCLNISRSEDSVDSPAATSLFWKLRHVHEYMPEFLCGPIKYQSLYFKFHRTNSEINGEASSQRSLVGGRGSTIFIDEFSQIREDTAVRGRTASSSGSRFFNGTHVGCGGEFYKLTQTPEIAKIQMHWTRHPEKNKGLYRWNEAKNQVDIIDKDYQFDPNYEFVRDGKPFGGPFPGIRSPWYDNKCIEIGNDRIIAEDLDINPSGSVSQFFNARVIAAMCKEHARPHEWEGDVQLIDGRRQLVEGKPGQGPLDKGAWPLKLWFIPDHNGKVPEAVYTIGGDIAWGFGATNSCITIFNADIGLRVGEYVSPIIYPEHLAPITIFLAMLFHDSDGEGAEMIWESLGPGTRFGKEVMELKYQRIYWNENVKAPFHKQPRKQPGWFPNPESKVQLLDAYKSALRDGDFLNLSELALEECLLFQMSDDGRRVEHTGSLTCDDPSGAGVNHGDRTMADALAYKASLKHAKRARESKKDEEVPVLSLQWRRNYRKQQKRSGRLR